jgi:hypothetical protein
MIDFASISKTIDGYACNYFGQRSVLINVNEWRVHCMAVWSPDLGLHEKWYDDQGQRLTIVGGRVVRSTSKKFRIVEEDNGK